MTEERMIRIKARTPKTKVQYHIKIYNGMVPDSWPDEISEKVIFSNLEPAPPKDWKPMCYYERDDIVGCSVNLPETWEDVPKPIKACYRCPYRKKDEQ